MASLLDGLALLAGYTLVFLCPFAFPPSAAWAILLIPLGCFLVPLVRGLIRPRRLVVLLVAAGLAGVFFSGFHLAALDFSIRLRYDVGFADAVLYRKSMIYALSPYGLFGGVGLAALALVGAESGRFLRERRAALRLNRT